MFILFGYAMLISAPLISSLAQKHLKNSLEKHINENENPHQQIERKILSTKILLIMDIAFLAILYIYLIGNFLFINECKTTSLCNIEIVSPYISDVEYKQLKSTFYSIQTKDDYINFTEAINKIGEQYSLDLKK